ncbi:DUF84 family protein [Candidatus Vampirococcus lugosii]|uniref:inosine/xanthosine triphosphatase n=1 Tax=Candidatus Vampirococcus lugosii TaxID=2789015 RepID=A0ABS5QLZ2_9BACT|nr:inosine/xanthosine triphosphatase [Candidatus Vampirococcus lugosii]MBS8122221.1 xanthosine triphosphate pyrophosphatase [Candidatus Vampirococcus lugosii]
MIIAIGTTREPKINGIKEGIKETPYLSNIFNEIFFITEKISSDISDMPLSIEETMKGAKNRANNLQKKGIKADYYIGIEGGTSDFLGKKYIFGIVFVLNNDGEGHFGFSPMMEVPKLIENELYIKGKELGDIMGDLSGSLNIRSKNGSMGAWSDNMFTRKDEFSIAFKAAIAPFYNKYYQL